MVAAIRFLVLLYCVTVGSIDVLAQGSNTEDGAAVRSVIERQLDAFRRDDGVAAFGYAAPNIKSRFGTVENFMAMVRQGYPPVYRPRSYVFTELKVSGPELEQRVSIVGPDDDDWIAIYTLERQPDGNWQITSCRLVRSEVPRV